MHSVIDSPMRAAHGNPLQTVSQPAGVSRAGIRFRPWRERLAPGLAAAALWGLLLPAESAPVVQRYVQQLDFVAPSQSIWGGNAGFSFGTAGSKGWSALNFSWDIGASTGMVTGHFNGDLTVDYRSAQLHQGAANLVLNFAGDAGGGQIKSDLGAWAKASASALGITKTLLDYGLGLKPEATFSPQLGTRVTGTDNDAVAGVDVDIGVLSAGVSLDIEQTNGFIADAITGTLAYSQRGSNVVQLTPFSLTGSSVQLNPILSDEGLWDLWFVDLGLSNRFDIGFDASLRFYERHVDGIQWCSRRVFGFTLRWPCGLTFGESEFELASMDLYNGSPFGLDFNNTAASGRFSIMVVPEPSSMLLVAVAIVALAGTSAATRARRPPPGAQLRR